MSLTKPMRIEEGEEREILKEWEWDHDTAPMDQIAILGAETLLDQIKQDCVMFITADNGTIQGTVNPFGECYFVFDLTDQLKELPGSIDDIHTRKLWQSEIEDLRQIAKLFRSITDDIERRVATQEGRGALDDQIGMNYDEWEAAGQPPIPE